MQRGDSMRRYGVARRSWVSSLTPRDVSQPATLPSLRSDQADTPMFDAEPAIDDLPKEYSVTIEINGRPAATLLCTPSDLRELGAGWVYSHGFVRDAGEIRSVTVRANRVSVMIDAPGPGGTTWQALMGVGFDASAFCGEALDDLGLEALPGQDQDNGWVVSTATFLKVVNYSFEIFRRDCSAGGHHHAASIDRSGNVVAMRDLSRHCAVDKVVGQAILKEPAIERRILCLSGRVSADIMLKAWRARFPIIATRSLPTAEAVRIAHAAGATLVGRVLDGRRAVYTNSWRISGERDRFSV